MDKIRTYLAIVALASGTMASAAETEHTATFYYYGDIRIPLTIVADEMSVGKSGVEELFNRVTLQVDDVAVEVHATQLGANMWRLRLDPPPPMKFTARLQPGIVNQPPPVQVVPSKEIQASRRIERQHQVIDALIDDETVDWAYPAYRNPDTGTLLWLTPRLIVGVDPAMDSKRLEKELPATLRLVEPLAQPDQYLVELVDPRTDDPLEVSARLKEEHSWVEWAEPDFIQDWRRALTPNDPLFSNQWHLQNTGQGGGTSGADARLPGAWDLETGDGSVVVAVIDDGVELTHPDLQIFTNPGEIPGNMTDDDMNGYVDDVNGWDFFYGDNDANPDLTGPGSHGTAVAGVAAATGNNSVGVSGACQNCEVLPLRVFNATSAASDSAFADAITYAGELADVLNNSWGGGSPVTAITTAIQGAVANGRGGLGSPTLVSTANSASGYIAFALTGFPSGTFTIGWYFSKDVSLSYGFDTAWIDNVTFPDGTTENFETCSSLPTGWSTSGDANWTAVSDGTRASSALGGHCSIGAGDIDDDETTSVMVTKTFATGGDLTFYLWPSSETLFGTGPATTSCYDGLGMTINGGDQGFLICGTYSNQGNPLQDGVIAYPANLSESIAVGAATNFDRRSDYSQWGPEIDFLCHSNGGSLGITTTDVVGANGYDPSDYTSTFGGTSSAAPLCSGIAALAITADPTLTAAAVRQSMRDNARQIGSYPYVGGFNQKYGFGAVDASAVVAAATPEARIIVEKQTDPDGSTQEFTFTTDYSPNFNLGDGDTDDSGPLAPGTYSVSELAVSGWELTSATCSDGSDPSSISLQAGETVTCTFNNEQDAKIIVEKQTVPDGSTQQFTFSTDYSANFSLRDGETNDSGPLDPGTYSVSELAVAGWELTSATCSDGSDPSSISLQAGETVTCTFNNTYDANIIVEKQTIPDGDAATFTFSGDAAGTIGDGQQLVAATGPGTFTSTETVPGGWSLFEIECDDGDSIGDVGGATATFNVTGDEIVTCVFTNCSDTYSTVDLSGVTVTGTDTFTACDTLTADTVSIESTGNARFRAGNKIVLENGFSVLSGGVFTAEIVGSP